MDGIEMTKKKNKKKKRGLKIFLIVLTVVLVLLVGSVVGACVYLFGGLDTVDMTNNDEELGVNEALADSGVVNIALFGIDSQADDGKQTPGNRSDAIIILSLDETHSVVKMTSILRDSKVPIEGVGEMNINQAYDIGGPTLAIKTLNQNFDLDIRDYVTVDFSHLAALVDAVGGVTVTLYHPEEDYINWALKENYPEESLVPSAGEVTLTGNQALMYSRIRGMDSDTIRAARQQNVMNAFFDRLMEMPKSQYPEFIRTFLSMVETSLSYSDLIGLSSFAVNGFTIEDNTIPLPDYETDLWGGEDENNWWCWVYDLDHATERLHHIIYGTPYDDPTTPEDETASAANEAASGEDASSAEGVSPAEAQ